MLAGRTVLLESDPEQGDRDEAGHLLRYLWLPDGRLYNLEMILAGYAREESRDRPYRYQAMFLAAEATAREIGLGVWARATPQ
jgi:micrococcal nuclease